MSGDYSRFTFKPRKRFSGVLMQQGRVQLDADWNEEVGILKRRWEIQATDTFGPAAVPRKTTPDGFKILTVNPFKVGAGRLYVDGLLAERFADDPWYSNLKLSPEPPPLTATDKAIIYLDVWEREVTYIEDADLLETALGGPDTATRTQVVWQIKVRKDPSPACDSPLPPPSAGRLSTRAVAPPASPDPCVLPPTGNYRGLENRFYRVEIHDGGPLGTATFKWSQENASIVSRVTKFDGKKIGVTRIGRDKVLRFQADDWVEVTDDVLELAGQPGKMAKVVATDEANLILELDRDVSAGFDPSKPERHTRVRRWDQKDNVDANGLLKTNTTGTWTVLPDGVEVLITADPANGDLRTGDAWSFAARAIDGSLETLVKEPPQVIHHHYAHLATWDGSVIHDCRRLWPDEGGCCCCTVEVGDGVLSHGDFDDIEDAYAAAVKQARGGVVRICILPGIHRPRRTVVIKHPNVTISGCGQDSRVEAPGRQSIFEIVNRGPSARLENLYLTSEDSKNKKSNPGAGASAPPPPAPLVLVNDAEDTTIEANLIESVGREAIRASGIGLLVSGNEIWGLPGPDVRIPAGGLIDLKSAERARVVGNRIGRGLVFVRMGSGDVFNDVLQPSSAGHGITFSERDDEKDRLLRDIVIAGNEIRGMRGSGIAISSFEIHLHAMVAPGTYPVFIERLRIEGNTITECAGLEVWMRPDYAPQGGIVLGGVEHLEITDNHVQGNGFDEKRRTLVAGIYVGHAKGLIVRNNVVTQNGLIPEEGEAADAMEGGVMGFDLSMTLVEEPTRLRPRHDWPCAVVHGNVVTAPRGTALTLVGVGPMQVTDNQLTAQHLRLLSTPFTGAVRIHQTAPSLLPLGFERSHYFDLNPGPLERLQIWSNLPAVGGSVLFSDNQVTLAQAEWDEQLPPQAFLGEVVRIEALDSDVAMHDNWVQLLDVDLSFMKANTLLLGKTARATGNGVFEPNPFESHRFLSVAAFGSQLCTLSDNQATHCLRLLSGRSGTTTVPPPQTNLSIHCDADEIELGFFEIPSVLQARDQLVARLLTLLKKSRGNLERKLIDALELDQTVLENVRTITPGHWTLTGRVLDRDGKPIERASVQTTDLTLTTDGNGRAFGSVPFSGSGSLQNVSVIAPDGTTVIWDKRNVFRSGEDRLHLFEIQEGFTPMFKDQPGPSPQPAAMASEEPKARKATQPRKAAKPRSRAKKET